MAIYLVSGRLGSGKTLATVGRIRDALLEGRRVATNLDLQLDKLLPARAGLKHPVSAIRLPDKPTVDDLEVLGMGTEEMDETRNGLIVLDELAAWLNARSWADKARQAVIDWLIHSRKLGWDVIFICQHLDQIDKQVRTALVEYHATCRRLDRLKVPYLGGLIQFLSGGYLTGTMPKIHVATVRYGTDAHAIKADRWVYRGRDLYAGYNTRQVFRSAELTDADHACANPPPGLYSYLSPWHTTGRYLPPKLTIRDYIAGIHHALLNGPPRPGVERKPKHPLVELVMRLPPDQRERHYRRLQSNGAI